MDAKLVAINITLDYLLQALRQTNYILIGMLIIFAIHEIFKIYTYFKNNNKRVR